MAKSRVEKTIDALPSWTANLEGVSGREARARPHSHLHFIETGKTGLVRYRDEVSDEWHPKLKGTRAMKIYRQMADNDAICGSYNWTVTSMMTGLDRNMQAAGEQPIEIYYRDKIDSMLDDMRQSWTEFISDAVTETWAGYSIFENLLKVRRGPDQDDLMLNSKHNDGCIAWRKWGMRGQQTIDGWEFDDNGEILGFYQRAAPDWIRTFTPIEQSLHFRTVSNRNNPEGRSLFRNAYRAWWYLTRIQKLEAIGVERDTAGLLVFQLPESYFDDDADADAQSTLENYRQLVERARRGEYEGLCIPAEEDSEGPTGWKLSQLQSGGRRPIDTNEIIKRLESRIAISLLGESVLLGMQGNVGSWALSSTKTHMLAISLRAIRDSITQTINRFAIPRIMQANKWPIDAAPTLELGDFETDDAGELVTTLVNATGSGLLAPGPELEAYLRSRLGVPEEQQLTPDTIGQGLEDLDTIDEANTEEHEDDAAQETLRQVVPIEQDASPVGAFMDLQEASEYIGVSPTVIRTWVDRGQLPGARVGRTVRLHRSDLDNYLRGRKPAAA